MPSRACQAYAPPAPQRVRWAGNLARAALLRSGGSSRPVPGFEATPFRLADSTLVWIGPTAPHHPRAVLLESEASADASEPWIDVPHLEAIASGHTVQTLGGQRFSHDEAARTASGAILQLVAQVKPMGFATLFAGATPPFPLSHRVAAAHATARACAQGDAVSLYRHAHTLLGAGPGLTPSGDDFVGGALFALRWWPNSPSWQAVSDDLVAAASHRTHLISATLLRDLADGQSYQALHHFADALAHSDDAAALASARALVAIGHSSGWDMLSGFTAALCGTLAFS